MIENIFDEIKKSGIGKSKQLKLKKKKNIMCVMYLLIDRNCPGI